MIEQRFRAGRLLSSVLLLMAAAIIIAGCNRSNGNEETRWPAMEVLASIGASDIISAQYTRSTEGGIERGSIMDPAQIEDIYLRLKDVLVAGKSDMAVDDDGLTIKLETSGKSLGFSFEGDILLLEDGSRYEVENLATLKEYIDGLITDRIARAQTAQ